MISGLISEDVIWTMANSPYNIIDNTTLKSGCTLINDILDLSIIFGVLIII